MTHFVGEGPTHIEIRPRRAGKRAVPYQHPIELWLSEVEGWHRCGTKGSACAIESFLVRDWNASKRLRE